MKRLVLIVLFLYFNKFLSGQELQTNIPAHDPVMIKQGNTYYLFCTGPGIAVWSSGDMKNWKREKPVFDTAPIWAVEAVPGFKNHIWAPDIAYHKGKYYLYYSVSTFGKNTSCIGVATNVTLNPSDPHYKWTDHGMLIQSVPGKTNWNAIDPNLIIDKSGKAYLAFGSFWDGLKMIRLKPDLLSPAEPLTHLPTIASRIKDSAGKGENPIEAPFIFRKNGYYYLFASIDYCCKGPNSTYKMIVGRSKNVAGPYLDRNNVPMEKGGGTLVMDGDKDWYGVGHNSVYTFDKSDYLIFHGYDASDKGKSKLRIEKLGWDKEKWPRVLKSATEKVD